MRKASLNRHSTVLLFVALATVIFTMARESRRSLWMVEKFVDIKYRVPDIDYRYLADRLADGAPNTLIFDTRRAVEFATSHIRWAVRVAPQMPARQFMKIYGRAIRGKHLVFYCSVGERSSRFVQRVREMALKGGALSVANLKGGIFRWYNEGLVVYGPHGKTNAIHPFNAQWGKLVKKRPG